MDVLTGVKTIDDYKAMEEKFKEYLIKEFGLDSEFKDYPLVEVRVSNLNKTDSLSPAFAWRDGELFDMVSNYVDEITFSIHAKIRIKKDKPG